MPIQTRPTDTFTRDNLLIGFSIVEFTPKITGGFGTPVMLGILGGEELQKEVETLALERGDSGLLTVDRELISRLQVRFQVEVFNFKADLAQYIFASSAPVAVVANAAQAVTDDPVTIPSTSPFDTFLQLARASINEASVAVECANNVSEAVGTGDGVLGGATGDFSLKFKVKAAADVTSFTVGGTPKTVVAGAAPAIGEVGVIIGEGDTPAGSRSGNLTFNAGDLPPNGAAIVATYKPSFTTGAGDIVNLTDFVFDPILGRIRFRNAGAGVSPFRPVGQPFVNQGLLVDYTYNRKANNTLKPFVQTSTEGKATIKHLTDVGVNFVWTIPSVTLRITDDALTFDAEEFATGILVLNVNDAGGTDRYGTLELSSEPEANA